MGSPVTKKELLGTITITLYRGRQIKPDIVLSPELASAGLSLDELIPRIIKSLRRN